MSNVTPVITTNIFAFDYYEVAYTCLATQYPNIGTLSFPNLTFANSPAYLSALSTTVTDAPTPSTIDGVFTTPIEDQNVITINDPRANNVITSNLGVEFYTSSWVDALDLCKSINTSHTYTVSPGGNLATYAQTQKARKLLWNDWWTQLLYGGADLSEFYQMGLEHSIDQMSAVNDDDFFQFQNWLENEHVCGSTIATLKNIYLGLPITPQAPSSILEQVIENPMDPFGVYFYIEKINASSDTSCNPVYSCVNSAPTSDGFEDESCVTYWVPTTQPTNDLSGTFPIGGCSLNLNSDYWSKYKNTPRPRFDFINVTGNFIIPDTTYIARSGITTINAIDIFNSCNPSYLLTIPFNPFSAEYPAPYNACVIIDNTDNKNWTVNASINGGSYVITVTPNFLNDGSVVLNINVPPNFFNDLRANPQLKTLQFSLQWEVKLTVQGDCLANAIIGVFAHNFYPFCSTTTLMKYVKGCGIAINNAQGYANGTGQNALVAINDMKSIIKQLFVNVYNCYAQQLSMTNVYGDIIKINGRFYDEHGSECWLLLKQTLRPNIQLSSNAPTQGLVIPNAIASIPTIETNTVLPPAPLPTTTAGTTTTLSSLFNKNGKKLCPVLPQNLRYK